MPDYVLRIFSSFVLFRGFNDAVNGFNEDGWQLMNMDAPKDAIISMKRTNISMGFDTNYDGVICMKTTVLLQVSYCLITFRH